MIDDQDVKYEVKMTRQDGHVKIEKFANRGEAADFAASTLMVVVSMDPNVSIDRNNTRIVEGEATMHVSLVRGGQFVCKIEAYPAESIH